MRLAPLSAAITNGWRKPLPLQNGPLFDLDMSNRRRYLHHKCELGEFFLSSDAIIRTFRRHLKCGRYHVADSGGRTGSLQPPRLHDRGVIVFPGNRINRKQTINRRRGKHPRIADRLDLTLDCIRRHYLRQVSPLSDTLALYSDFFDLFVDFRGYVDFFLLQDLVTDDYRAIRFFTDSPTPAIPATLPP